MTTRDSVSTGDKEKDLKKDRTMEDRTIEILRDKKIEQKENVWTREDEKEYKKRNREKEVRFSSKVDYMIEMKREILRKKS